MMLRSPSCQPPTPLNELHQLVCNLCSLIGSPLFLFQIGRTELEFRRESELFLLLVLCASCWPNQVPFGMVVECPTCMIAAAVAQPQHGIQMTRSRYVFNENMMGVHRLP